jgi:hypothetical protein
VTSTAEKFQLVVEKSGHDGALGIVFIVALGSNCLRLKETVSTSSRLGTFGSCDIDSVVLDMEGKSTSIGSRTSSAWSWLRMSSIVQSIGIT